MMMMICLSGIRTAVIGWLVDDSIAGTHCTCMHSVRLNPLSPNFVIYWPKEPGKLQLSRVLGRACCFAMAARYMESDFLRHAHELNAYDKFYLNLHPLRMHRMQTLAHPQDPMTRHEMRNLCFYSDPGEFNIKCSGIGDDCISTFFPGCNFFEAHFSYKGADAEPAAMHHVTFDRVQRSHDVARHFINLDFYIGRESRGDDKQDCTVCICMYFGHQYKLTVPRDLNNDPPQEIRRLQHPPRHRSRSRDRTRSPPRRSGSGTQSGGTPQRATASGYLIRER